MNQIQYKQIEGGQILLSPYEGRNIDIMPKLLQAGQNPISFAEIMDLRNAVFKSADQNLINRVCYNHIDSRDGIVYDNKTGDIKISLDCPNLKNLTSSSERNFNNFGHYFALNLEKENGAKRFFDLPDEDP